MGNLLVANVEEFFKIERNKPPYLRVGEFRKLVHIECHSEKDFNEGYFNEVVICRDPYRKESYRFPITAKYGDVYSESFNPVYTPRQMLNNGVFEGRYLNSLYACFPHEWWQDANISIYNPDVNCNYFKVKSRNSLQDWKAKMDGIRSYDPRGWFEWYCLYFIGRRIPGYDDWQIGRWRKFARHQAGLKANLLRYRHPSDYYNDTVYPVNRQALLQWSWHPFPIVGHNT